MHDKFCKYLDKDYIDMELSFEWMKHTELNREAEELAATYIHALNTRY